MSKTISNDLKTHMAGTLTSMATCWRVTRVDGTEYFFTDLDVDLTVDGDLYEAASGMLPTAPAQKADLSVDDIEVVSFLESTKIDAAALRAGDFDFATVDIFQVNYKDLTQGKLWLAQGWTLGAVTINDEDFRAELRSLFQHLQQMIVELTSPTCRATLGDARCGVDLDDSAGTFRHEGAVTAVGSNRLFLDSSVTESTDVFRYGKVVWADGSAGGANAGRSMQIKKYTVIGDIFELVEPMPDTIQTGDQYTAFFGCDKKLATCRDTFNIVVNFRGEPFIPGNDETLKVSVP